MVYHYNLSAKMPYCLQLLKGAVHSLVEKEKTVVIFCGKFSHKWAYYKMGGTSAYE